MGRAVLSSECDELEHVINKRNVICSERFLRALQAHHGNHATSIRVSRRQSRRTIPSP